MAEVIQVLFEWKAYPHVDFGDSYAFPLQVSANTSTTAWDFFHMNSVRKDSVGAELYGLINPLGNYLVSSRHYCAVYYINGSSGDILWTLNGQHSNFTMGETDQLILI